jgi:autotransporter adhesin
MLPMGVGMRGILIIAALIGATSAHAENCLTNSNTGTSTTVSGTAGSFFQLGTSDVVRFPNPPGISNAAGVTLNGSSNTPGNALTGLSCGQGAKASGKQAVAIGQNAVAVAPNSVALGSGAVATRANSVSVGSPAMPNQITNVASGTAATDAVNVAQLATVAGPLQSQINNVQNQVTTLKKQTFAGISMAMAAAALQTGAGAQGAGKVAIGLGGGEFGGTASLSAGIAYSPTKRLNFNAGMSVAPIVGMFGVFAGTTYTLN